MDTPLVDKDGFKLLNPTHSELWKKTTYLSKVGFIANRIYEYDIRSANTSALRGAKVLKQSTLDELEQLPRHDREVAVGRMILADKSIGKVIKRGITRAKEQLFIANKVQDEEVLSIKNDAVFVIGRRLKETTFGTMEFKEKNMYSAFLPLDSLELYYKRKAGTVDIKGIKDEVVNDPDQQNGMVLFLGTVMEYLVMDRRDALREYLIAFTDQYKSMKLPVQYYKELSGENIYRTVMEISNFGFQMQVASDADKPMINGVYNFKRFVLPLIQMYI